MLVMAGGTAVSNQLMKGCSCHCSCTMLSPACGKAPCRVADASHLEHAIGAEKGRTVIKGMRHVKANSLAAVIYCTHSRLFGGNNGRDRFASLRTEVLESLSRIIPPLLLSVVYPMRFDLQGGSAQDGLYSSATSGGRRSVRASQHLSVWREGRPTSCFCCRQQVNSEKVQGAVPTWLPTHLPSPIS